MSDQQSGLTVEDIQMVSQLIDYAANQGTFREWSIMQAAVQVNGRLKGFLEMAAKSTAQPQDTPIEGAAE